MSANNWTTCPKCLKKRDGAHRSLQADTKALYGKIPEELYTQRVAEMKATLAEEMEESLREDWELGIGSDGGFFVHYRGQCDKCNFEHKFKHEEKLKL